ncbi:hypothetical protein [Mycolicibacter kumamotonensis]|nr:hypothetical protein [Mycolicibacter kumamotonensis]
MAIIGAGNTLMRLRYDSAFHLRRRHGLALSGVQIVRTPDADYQGRHRA